MTTQVGKSLSQRLGGVINDLYDRMLNDRHTWYYWKGRSAASMATECQLFTDLACANVGEPGILRCPDMKKEYIGLGIIKVEWAFFINLAAETLDQSGLTDREREEVFSILARSKAAITANGQALPASGVFAAFPHQLTQREREVLRLVALGKNNPEIAAELFISVNTVTRHLTNIFVKTSTKNRVEAAVYAARRRLV